MRCHLITVRKINIKKIKMTYTGKGAKNRENFYAIDGNYISTTIVEYSMKLPQKN